MYYSREIKSLWFERLCEKAEHYLIKERLPDCLFCDSAEFSCNVPSVCGCVVFWFFNYLKYLNTGEDVD